MPILLIIRAESRWAWPYQSAASCSIGIIFRPATDDGFGQWQNGQSVDCKYLRWNV